MQRLLYRPVVAVTMVVITIVVDITASL